MNLDFLTTNPLIKKMALGKIREAMKESETSLITIELDSNGELVFKDYQERMIVMTETEFNKTITALL